MNAEVGILGGGLTGLSLAALLGRKAEVLEAAEQPGGLLKTFGKGGFLSDVGGHILFSRDQEALDLMREWSGNAAQRRRNNKVRWGGTYVKYPFENDLGALPLEDRYECLIGFVKNEYPPPPHRSFQDWMYYTFGRGITERYLLPYNRKIWKMEPSGMGTQWVDRVPRPPVEDVVKSALGIPTEGYTHQLYFYYPAEGGIASLAAGVAARVRQRQGLVTGEPVREVRRTADGWQVNGHRNYRRIVSAMPIVPLLEALGDVPARVMEAARALRTNAIRCVLLGIGRREGLDEITAIYDPDESVLAHRVCFNCAFSPAMAPPGQASLCCEITTRPGLETYTMDDRALIERTFADLVRVGVLRHDDRLVEAAVQREELAYVVYDLDYVEKVDVVRSFYRERGILAAGRFAEHDYINMDACVRRALDVSRRLDADLNWEPS